MGTAARTKMLLNRVSGASLGRLAAYLSPATRCFSSQPAVTDTLSNLRKSGIRAIMARASEIESGGTSVTHLEVGQPNFAPPQHVIDSTIASLERGETAYVANNGIAPLRDAVANYYATVTGVPTSAENVIVTNGSMLSIYSLQSALLNPGDEVLIPNPGFPNYQQGCAMARGSTVTYPCWPSNDFLPTLQDLEQRITDRTKLLILCNPGNPTGAVYPKQLLDQILQMAVDRGLYIISDEIYSQIVFDKSQPFTSALELLGDHPNLAVVSGVSKAYAMCGYRVGWTRASKTIVENLTKLQEPLVSCGVSFAQAAAVSALNGPQDDVEMMRLAYKSRRDAALRVLAERGRPASFVPGGAFYLPVDVTASGASSLEFASRLLEEKHVAVAPGEAFDTEDNLDVGDDKDRALMVGVLNGFVRVSLANSEENVEIGVSKLCDLLDEMG